MSAQTAVRGFTVAHQKFSIDVDLESCRLSGWTELTVVPSDPALRTIVLDARRLRVISTTVNGQNASFIHRDLLSSPPSYPGSWNIEQYHLYKEKLGSLFRELPEGELWIDLPQSYEIMETESTAFMGSHSIREKTYEPITVRVEFELDGSTTKAEGINFVCGRDSGIDCSKWHAYTTHTPIGVSTSCWLPCVDGLGSLSTWEMEFAVPKTLAVKDNASEEDLREMVVVCNNVNPTQVLHSTDESKKVVRFQVFTPVSSQHIGFAVGPFSAIALTSSYDDPNAAVSNGAASNGNAVNGSNAVSSGSGMTGQPSAQGKESKGNGVPITVYCLSEQSSLVLHCCKIFVRAMAYFSRDFGSFPFDSYSICFVSQLPYDEVDAAALTLISEKMLFPENMIEPLFDFTEPLIRGLAAQWCGVNIVPQTCKDLWVTEGMAMFMTHLFVRRLMGNNEYRFRMCKYRDEICKEDIGRAPLGAPLFQFPLCPDDLWFLRLKAPMVLYILDRRMTKTDRSLGITRVLSKLLLQSMSGDLRSQLSSSHFIKVCEKVAHHRLDAFFSEWVYSSGYPIIRVTQRFNKKRMFIEMGIGQVQSHELPSETLRSDKYIDRAVCELLNSPERENNAPPEVFTGPMTIRIHEADGTPYEHIVDLREHFTKLDIQYNTKYKRLKRSQKYRAGGSRADSVDPGGNDTSELVVPAGANLIHCLGDVLMTPHEKLVWGLKDWGSNESNNDEEADDNMFNEAFEWVRVDADFEWLGKIFVGQPDYMYASQLQQDRDVVAQYDAVTFFKQQNPNQIYSTVLTRTLMDHRYYHGVRQAAAFGLTNHGTFGTNHLRRALQTLYCFPNQNVAAGKHIIIPRANDFRDFASYFVQKAVIHSLSLIRDPQGRCVSGCANELMCMLQYNENSGNPYSDSLYTASLVKAVATMLLNLNPGEVVGGLVAELDMAPVRNFVGRVITTIDKCQRLDRWVPSWHHIVTTTALHQDELLVRAGYCQPRMEKLLEATRSSSQEVRLTAFQSLLNLGGYRNKAILNYIFKNALDDPDAAVRVGTLQCLGKAIGEIAIYGEYYSPNETNTQDKDQKSVRQRAIARRSVATSISLVREVLKDLVPLQNLVWEAITSSHTSTLELRYLFQICEVLYQPVSRFMVSLKAPPMYRLSMRKRNNYLMVVRYRSILKKKNKASGLLQNSGNGNGAAENGVSETKLDNGATDHTTSALLSPPADNKTELESNPSPPKLKLKLGFK